MVSKLRMLREEVEIYTTKKEAIRSLVTGYYNAILDKDVNKALNMFIYKQRDKKREIFLTDTAKVTVSYDINIIAVLVLNDKSSLLIAKVTHKTRRSGKEAQETQNIYFELKKENGFWKIANIEYVVPYNQLK
ncbi:hypothetical protein MBAV_003190 [Candidatus Magnetobacterium bavaricum]|uniref:Uncharacterized protein n=1 Tax=Candidatus Magnetobacterium bavaricum TaxID=29290 RepID=A0A0F3GRN9_9BACT|nr:hypothetical protein MBAV_003190 [Candidatus Magnetobacterium bavaricum]